MIDSHLFLCDTGTSVPGRWMQAFPEGQPLDDAALQQRLRSHSLTHGLVWMLASAGPEPWAGRVARLLSLQPDLKIVLLSGVPDEDEGLTAIQAGVRGYAHSHAVPALLQEVALVVHHGGLWLGPDLMRKLVRATASALSRRAPLPDQPSTSPAHPPGRAHKAPGARDGGRGGARAAVAPEPANAAWARLTGRERQMARSVAQGRSNKEIASLMRISEKTVKAHLGQVFQKLGVRDRLQLVVRMAAVDVESADTIPHSPESPT